MASFETGDSNSGWGSILGRTAIPPAARFGYTPASVVGQATFRKGALRLRINQNGLESHDSRPF